MMQSAAPLMRGTVLLVDTRCTMLRRFGDSLQRAGCDVVQAASFEDAKHALAIHRPHLLVTNLRLGAFNGLHLLHLGRLVAPELETILITTPSDFVLKDEAENLGACVMVEPVHTNDLITTVGRLLGLAAPARLSPVLHDRRVSDRRRLHIAGFSPERRIADRRVAASNRAGASEKAVV
jgi:DNA-binding NtrC family response regulator